MTMETTRCHQSPSPVEEPIEEKKEEEKEEEEGEEEEEKKKKEKGEEEEEADIYPKEPAQPTTRKRSARKASSPKQKAPPKPRVSRSKKRKADAIEEPSSPPPPSQDDTHEDGGDKDDAPPIILPPPTKKKKLTKQDILDEKKKRTLSWVNTHKKEIKEITTSSSFHRYDVQDLDLLKASLKKEHGKNISVHPSYHLPLFDFMGTNSIVFERIGEFDGVVKGNTSSQDEYLDHLDMLLVDPICPVSTEVVDSLKERFSKRWWKLPNDSVCFKSRKDRVAGQNSAVEFLGSDDPVRCELLDVRADVREAKGDLEKAIFLRPICRYSKILS